VVKRTSEGKTPGKSPLSGDQRGTFPTPPLGEISQERMIPFRGIIVLLTTYFFIVLFIINFKTTLYYLNK
jgi:hypothetical protein